MSVMLNGQGRNCVPKSGRGCLICARVAVFGKAPDAFTIGAGSRVG